MDKPGKSEAPASADSIRLEHVSKFYGTVEAVKDLSLTVKNGEFLTLLGPSGCGKTTTLRLIAGFEQANAGAVRIDGIDMVNQPPYRRPVNTVFQQYALFPHLDVRANVAYGLKHAGVGKAEIAQRVTRMMELMQIPNVGDRRPAQLSGGQQQRVALARALVMEPAVLLLDEPLGSLDYKLRKAMQYELKRIHNEVGVTFVYVTHDQEEAMTMSDRIVVMSGGRIEQEGTPEEIYDRPTTAFVADFIGDSNLIEGTVSAVDGSRAEVQLGQLGTVAGTAVGEIVVGKQVLASLRPGDIEVEEDPAGEVEVRDAVLAGAHVALTLDCAGDLLKAHVSRNQGIAVGKRIRLRLDPSRTRIFPRQDR